MPGPFSPNDDLVGPLVHQIALLVQAQIPSVGTVYEKMPDSPPQDNSVLLPLLPSKIMDETDGKVRVMFRFGMRHIFRRKKFSDNVAVAYTYITPWLKFLAAWPNQSLGGLAREVTATDLAVTQTVQSGQPVVALAVTFSVLTEFNIPLS